MIRRFAQIATLLVSGSALASEKPVAKSAVPKAVLQTVASSYPKAKVLETVLETEDNRRVYEVRLESGSARVDLKIDPSGKLFIQEHLMDVKAAPVAVTNAAVAPPYAEWKIDRVEKIDNLETPDQSGYEVLIEHQGVKREVLLHADGKLIKIEDADDTK